MFSPYSNCFVKSFLGSVTVFGTHSISWLVESKQNTARRFVFVQYQCQIVGLTNVATIKNSCHGSSSPPCSSQCHPTKIQFILRFSNSRFDRKSWSMFCGCSLTSRRDRLFQKTRKFGHSMIRDLAIKIDRFRKLEKCRTSPVAKNLRCTYLYFFCWANHIYIYIYIMVRS